MNRSRELAAILLERARGDAWMLNHMLQDAEAPLWGLAFHAQQCVAGVLTWADDVLASSASES